MDIVTQGLLGATMALSVSRKHETKLAAGIGFAAALLADADTLIRSSNDPLLNIEFHRHFTHSLLFIPVGALIAAILIWPIIKKHLPFRKIYFYALAGYATSGLLDACTSYGTQLLWPFSDERIAWRIIAIVDPVFSLILIVAIIVSLRARKQRNAQFGLLLAGCYLLFGVYQHSRAHDVAVQLAQQRGHTIKRQLVKPTMANLILWRSVYQSDGLFFVDAIRVVPFSDEHIFEGDQVKPFEQQHDMPELDSASALHHDIDRFRYFSDDYVILDPAREKVLVDLRYSMLPNGLAPLWGIDMNVGSTWQHAQFVNFRDGGVETRLRFVDMLMGR
ncbi:MAG: metal-dependent hydrolase [Gammaproteobacteria bacterium]|nr:metal-dependent hydrolase [Gammaproteobacteria bacterium]